MRVALSVPARIPRACRARWIWPGSTLASPPDTPPATRKSDRTAGADSRHAAINPTRAPAARPAAAAPSVAVGPSRPLLAGAVVAPQASPPTPPTQARQNGSSTRRMVGEDWEPAMTRGVYPTGARLSARQERPNVTGLLRVNHNPRAFLAERVCLRFRLRGASARRMAGRD